MDRIEPKQEPFDTELIILPTIDEPPRKIPKLPIPKLKVQVEKDNMDSDMFINDDAERAKRLPVLLENRSKTCFICLEELGAETR